MPSNSQYEAVARMWEMLKLLPSHKPGMTISDIRQSLANQGYDVDRRTVERNLEKLELLFPITHGDDKPYGWHWENKKAFETLGLSITDALTLNLLERFMEQLLPIATRRQLKPLFDLAKSKLDAEAESNEIARWASLIAVVETGLPVDPPDINQTILETVQTALLKREKLKILYTKAGADTAKEHTVNPVGLMQSGGKIYLIAANTGRSKSASYALHRIDKAERTWDPANIPKEISLQSFVDEGGAQFFNKGKVELKAWVSKRLGDQLAETCLTGNQQLTPIDGGFELAVTLPNSLRLRQWILSWTGHIEIRGPETLREDIAKQLHEGVELYS